jgi:hypothetical protein
VGRPPADVLQPRVDQFFVTQGQLEGVFKVDSGQIAHFRLVRLGRTYENRVEILAGLKPGDRYVQTPPVTLADGTKIEVGSWAPRTKPMEQLLWEIPGVEYVNTTSSPGVSKPKGNKPDKMRSRDMR